MIEPEDNDKFEPFLQSTEGRRIILFTVLLVLVVGGLVFTLLRTTSRSGRDGDEQSSRSEKRLENARKHWKVILNKIDRSGSGRIIFSEPAYQSMYRELRDGTQNQLTFLRYKQKRDDFSVDQFIEEPAALRGSVVPFRGTVVEKAKKIPVDAGDMTVWELWVRHPKRSFTYRIHLLKPPAPEKLGRKGARVEGEGVFLTLRENQVAGGEDPSTVPVIMCHNVRRLGAGRTSEATDGDTDSGGTVDSGGTPSSGEKPAGGSTGTSGTSETNGASDTLDWRKIPAPETYDDRRTVVSYWGKLLASLPSDNGLPRSDPLYHRLLRELERVEPSTFERWASDDIRAEWLTDPGESRLYRGEVVSFRGQYMYGKRVEVPGTDRSMWEFWLRNRERRVTYTIHSFKDVRFRLEKGNHLKGEGLYLQSPLYDLRNPGKGGKNRSARTIFLLAHELEPAFPDRREGMAAIDWFEMFLGGLFVVFLLIFIVMVFMTTRNEAGEKTRYLRELREGRKKSGASDNIKKRYEGEADGGDPSSS